MKKLLIFILCLGMIFTVAACGLSDNSSSNGGTESSGNIDNSSDLQDDSSNDSSSDSSDDSARIIYVSRTFRTAIEVTAIIA